MMAKSGKAWSKQTEGTLTSVCDNLRSGVPFARSCKVSGISESTGHSWRSEGWTEIQEREDLDSDAELSFPARFAVEVEIAARDFMAPMVQRIRDGAIGKSKGDWRAAQSILNSLYPHEFSEKVATAKSAKVEISGTVTHEMRQIYDDHLRWKNMDRLELKYELERLDAQIVEHAVEGENLDAEITFLEGKLAAMCQSRARGTPFYPGNWLTGNPAIRATVPKVIDLDEYEVSTDLAADALPESAPIEAGAENNPFVCARHPLSPTFERHCLRCKWPGVPPDSGRRGSNAMTAPTGFVEVSLADTTETLACVIAIDQIAVVKEASSYGLAVKSLVVLECGQVIQLATPFSSIVERMAAATEGDAE